jgi:hypothetical protein
MFVIAGMTVLCAAGVAFYVRFLVALFRECRFRQSGYWVRPRLDSDKGLLVEMQESERPVARAA